MDFKFLIALLISFGFASAAPQLPTGAIAQIPVWLDTDGDGVISELERQAFAEARKNAGQSLRDQWDKNHDGKLDEGEQQAATSALAQEALNKLRELFLSVAGEDQQLSLAEFANIPVSGFPSETAGRLYKLLDTDQSGLVSFEEFITSTSGPRLRGTKPESVGKP